MKLSLIGKNALVCGASRGIGKASAIELSKLGANVTLLARTEASLILAMGELDTSKGQVHTILVADATNHEDITKKISELVSKKVIQVLVNNTGGPAAGPITDAKPEQFMAAFAHHLVSNHIISSLVIPGMKTENFGRIINMI